VLTATRSLGEYFEEVVRAAGDARAAANWVMGEVLALANELRRDLRHIASDPPVAAGRLGELIGLVRGGALSNSAAKQVFAALPDDPAPPRDVAGRLNLLQVRDDAQLAEWVDAVLAENPDEAARFRGGERKLQGVLVGLVMKKSQGRADPKKVNQMLTTRVTV
jgi:aspartyl-tRNA(Asn)/glutamyl-tRNA(Gln) amidotransferase subunit B